MVPLYQSFPCPQDGCVDETYIWREKKYGKYGGKLSNHDGVRLFAYQHCRADN